MPISISPRGEERIRNGHPWIYRSDVVEVDAAGGDTVRVTSARGRPIGYALYSDRSEIAIRLLTRQDEAPTIETWRERIAAAIAYRATLRIDATTYRLVHGEGDRLPSLIVDRYGDYLVVQTLSQGSDRMLPQIVDVLVSIAQPAGILARNDPKVRALEGLEQKVEVLFGTVPESIEVREGRVSYEVDLYRGQKTGLFLDQRENREAAARYARGRLLDAFSYNGGFGLALAPLCDRVLAVDISEEAVARIGANRDSPIIFAGTGWAGRRSRAGNSMRQTRPFARWPANIRTSSRCESCGIRCRNYGLTISRLGATTATARRCGPMAPRPAVVRPARRNTCLVRPSGCAF